VTTVPAVPPIALEVKVAAGSLVTVISGIVTWTLVAWVPAFHSGVPQEVQDIIPVIVAWIVGTIAAYLAPHTNRPDIPATGVKTGAETLPLSAGGGVGG
jgi:hypothetical protein